MDEKGNVEREEMTAPSLPESKQKLVLNGAKELGGKPLRFYLFGTNSSRLKQVARESQKSLKIVADFKQADLFLTTRSYYRRKPQKIRDAEALGIPIYVLKSNDSAQMKQCLDAVYSVGNQSTYIHHLQYLLTERGALGQHN